MYIGVWVDMIGILRQAPIMTSAEAVVTPPHPLQAGDPKEKRRTAIIRKMTGILMQYITNVAFTKHICRHFVIFTIRTKCLHKILENVVKTKEKCLHPIFGEDTPKYDFTKFEI